MKALIWKALRRSLAVCAVAGTLGSSVLGQETQTAPAPPLAPRSRFSCVDRSPEARYDSLFMAVSGWDEAAKSFQAAGNAEMAEAWRTRLQKYSGLTAEEAEQVKQIGRDYLARRKAFWDKASALGSQYRAAHPHEWRNLNDPDPPELAGLRQERLDVVRQAEAKLVTALGSRSFSRLDLYVIHMDDWSRNNNKAPRHPLPPCGGPQ